MNGLSNTPRGSDAIWVFYRLTKPTHFISIKISFSLHKLAGIHINMIVKLHGIPPSIVSEKDKRFTSRFWESFQKALNTKLRFTAKLRGLFSL